MTLLRVARRVKLKNECCHGDSYKACRPGQPRVRDVALLAGTMSLILSQEMGGTLAQRRRCGTRDCAFLHLCDLSGFFWILSFYTNEHEAKVRYPRRHWMSLRSRLIQHGMI